MRTTVLTILTALTIGCCLADLPAAAAATGAEAATAGALALAPGGAASGGGGRAGWLLARADVPGPAAGRQGEVGGTRGGSGWGDRSRFGAAVPVLASLVVPGAGHLMIGHPAGLPLVALDAASWLRISHHDAAGGDVRDTYLAYAEAHWSEDRLDAAFLGDDRYPNVSLVGRAFFSDVDSKEDLPLWISREADEREWFENLGKWDQFIFGWDDFVDPRTLPGFTDPPGLDDLRLPGVSVRRQIYRGMRELANDHFEQRDRYVYLNIATRVVSAFHVAYLQGLLGGEPRRPFAVAGHELTIVAEPRGLTGGRLAMAVAY